MLRNESYFYFLNCFIYTSECWLRGKRAIERQFCSNSNIAIIDIIL